MSADDHTPGTATGNFEGRAAWLWRILDALPTMVAYIDRDRRYQFLNEAYSSFFGPDAPSRLLGLRVEEALSPELTAVLSPNISRALGGEDFVFKGRLKLPSGRIRQFQTRYIPDIDPDGEVLGLFLQAVDITDEVRIQRALRYSEESFRALVERSPQPMVVNVDRQIRYANDAALAMVGAQSFEEVEGRSIMAFITPESAPDAMKFSLAAREHPDGIANAELSLKTRNGRPRRVEARATAFKLGEELAVQVLLRDITHQRLLEQDLVRTAKLESLGLLAGGIAHDFNNLLTGILGSIEILAKDHADPRSASLLERARRNSERARVLAGQLLTFSKGGAPITQALNPAPLIREATELAIGGFAAKTVYDLPEDLWAVEVDPNQIHQVFNNIALNAAQALDQSGEIRIVGCNRRITNPTVPGRPVGTWVVISVEDNGVGIPSKHLPRVFDPYFSTRPGSTGLGLSAAFSIVRSHCGWLDIRSTPGDGTSVEVGLPALPDLKVTEPTRSMETIFGRGRILVMDDEASVREVAGEMLETLGYLPTMVKDGVAALASWEAARAAGEPFDAVIMDLSIPGGMGGLETVRRLRDLDPDAVAVVSSGYSNDPVMANYSDHGFRGVIRKPYFLAELGRSLADALSGSRERSEAP